MAAGRSEDVSFWLEPKLNLVTNFKIMWLIVTFLLAVQYMPSACGTNLILRDSNPSATFKTSRYLVTYNSRKQCSWVVTAPKYIKKLYLVCDLALSKSPGCSRGSFSFFNCGRKNTICKEGKIEVMLEGSTNTLTFKKPRAANFSPMGLSCSVSYNLDDRDYQSPCPCGMKRKERIINGILSQPNRYPWLAMLTDSILKYSFCGGSLISNRWVLTSITCLIKKTASQVLVVFGEHQQESFSPNRETFPVKQIIRHENYDETTGLDKDISLLELGSRVYFTGIISPICLPFKYKDYDFSGNNGILAGWGDRGSRYYFVPSKSLKELNQQLIMASECTSSKYPDWATYQITENMICGMNMNGGPCMYDAGGPLVWRNESSNLFIQIGIIPLYKICNNYQSPVAYIRVSKFLDWIKERTGEDFCIEM